MHKIVALYKFCKISKPSCFQKVIKAELSALHILGTIIIGKELKDLKVNLKLITDGDVSGALLVSEKKFNVDILGIGYSVLGNT